MLLFWHCLVPYTDESPHLKLIYYSAVISGLCGLLTSAEVPPQTRGEMFLERAQYWTQRRVSQVHIVIRVTTHLMWCINVFFFLLNAITNLISPKIQGGTERCKHIYDKGKFYSTLISCVGNIIYQIKHVPAGKLRTNYTVNHRWLCSMTVTAHRC